MASSKTSLKKRSGTAKAHWHIKSHQVKEGGLEENLSLKQFVEFFLDEFLTLGAMTLADFVYERLKSGRFGVWHKSRNPRYNYYRAWLLYRYGSSRRRRNMKGKGVQASTHSAYQTGLMSRQENLDRYRYEFLVRKIHQMQNKGGGISGLDPDTQQAFLRFNRRLNQIRDNHQARKGDDPDAARRYMNDALRRLFDGRERDTAGKRIQGEYVQRFAKETRFGQKLMRWADIAAMRHERNMLILKDQQALLDQEDEQTFGGFNVSERTRRRQEASYQMMRQDWAKGNVPNASGKRRMKSIKSGNFRWGFQTGGLAKAWKNSVRTPQVSGMSGKVVLQPKNDLDSMITNVLKSARVRGKHGSRRYAAPNLVNQRMLKTAVRDTLKEIQSLMRGAKRTFKYSMK